MIEGFELWMQRVEMIAVKTLASQLFISKNSRKIKRYFWNSPLAAFEFVA